MVLGTFLKKGLFDLAKLLFMHSGRILINVRRVLFLEEGKATAISDVVKQYNL